MIIKIELTKISPLPLVSAPLTLSMVTLVLSRFVPKSVPVISPPDAAIV